MQLSELHQNICSFHDIQQWMKNKLFVQLVVWQIGDWTTPIVLFNLNYDCRLQLQM
jgi:hypothetical protein